MVFKNSRKEQFLWLSRLGFETVEFVEVTAETLSGAVHGFAEKIEHYDIPSDGLVLLYDDIAYGQSLGRTAKFPRDSIAFKWADEIQETTLSYIEWRKDGDPQPERCEIPLLYEPGMPGEEDQEL